MKVSIEMHDGKKIEYNNVERIGEEKYQIKIYNQNNDLIAMLNKGDIKNLRSED
jgi:hypothetical protein